MSFGNRAAKVMIKAINNKKQELINQVYNSQNGIWNTKLTKKEIELAYRLARKYSKFTRIDKFTLSMYGDASFSVLVKQKENYKFYRVTYLENMFDKRKRCIRIYNDNHEYHENKYLAQWMY